MPNAVVRSVDMDDEMQEFAVVVAKRALADKASEQDVATEIRTVFTNKYGRTWHCIVGRHFATQVTYEKGSYAYFHIGQTGITLFSTA
eukprot:g1957.t1